MTSTAQIVGEVPAAVAPAVAAASPPPLEIDALNPAMPTATFERWPNERTRSGLVSEDELTRFTALGMAAQPNAPIDDWASELVTCVDLSRGHAIMLQIAATILTQLKQPAARTHALPCLVSLATVENEPPVRLVAANGFWTYQCIPREAWFSVGQMVFSDDAGLRKVAFAAALPHAEAGAREIAAAAASAGAVGWKPEGLDLLAASAGASDPKKRQVETYVMRTLEGETRINVMVAGYSALARLNPKGAGVSALAHVAVNAASWSDAALALNALRQMAELASPAIPVLVKHLVVTDEPEHEELLVHTLLDLKISERDVPIARVLQRLESGPDQSVVAHCIFLGLHAKAFARTAPLVAARFTSSSDTLRRVLDAVYNMLTGKRLLPPVAAGKT